MDTKICDYERDLLRHLNGEGVPGLRWGAAMGEAIEFLHGLGYVERISDGRRTAYFITDSGRAALNDEAGK